MQNVLAALASDPGTLVVPPPGDGPGFWAGGPSAVLHEGVWWLSYRLRRPVTEGRGYANVVARSDDGVRFETVCTVTSAALGAASLERPALVALPGGGWRLYVSCSTEGSKHWWVDALDAETPAGLAEGTRTTVLAGDATEAWKDVVVSTVEGWQLWGCRHPLDGGDDEADRMSTWFFESPDGLAWSSQGEALGAGTGWDARGSRITSVLHDGSDVWALYDGRASAAENWFERTGLAHGAPGKLAPVGGPVPAAYGPALRYASVVPCPEGLRVFFETARADGANELRTLLVR